MLKIRLVQPNASAIFYGTCDSISARPARTLISLALAESQAWYDDNCHLQDQKMVLHMPSHVFPSPDLKQCWIRSLGGFHNRKPSFTQSKERKVQRGTALTHARTRCHTPGSGGSGPAGTWGSQGSRLSGSCARSRPAGGQLPPGRGAPTAAAAAARGRAGTRCQLPGPCALPYRRDRERRGGGKRAAADGRPVPAVRRGRVRSALRPAGYRSKGGVERGRGPRPLAVVRSPRSLQMPIGARWDSAVPGESEAARPGPGCRGELGTDSSQPLPEKRIKPQLSIGSGGQTARTNLLPARRPPPRAAAAHAPLPPLLSRCQAQPWPSHPLRPNRTPGPGAVVQARTFSRPGSDGKHSFPSHLPPLAEGPEALSVCDTLCHAQYSATFVLRTFSQISPAGQIKSMQSPIT